MQHSKCYITISYCDLKGRVIAQRVEHILCLQKPQICFLALQGPRTFQDVAQVILSTVELRSTISLGSRTESSSLYSRCSTAECEPWIPKSFLSGPITIYQLLLSSLQVIKYEHCLNL